MRNIQGLLIRGVVAVLMTGLWQVNTARAEETPADGVVVSKDLKADESPELKAFRAQVKSQHPNMDLVDVRGNVEAVLAPRPARKTRVAAIFVADHADRKYNLDDKLGAFEDFITTRITGDGFSVISREVATDALSSMLKDGKQTDADQLLSNNSSALRLGQMLGADYLIMATISSYGSHTKSVEAYGVKTVNAMHTLRVTYKIIDGTSGGTLAGDTVSASKTIRLTENSQEEDDDLVNDLLDEASVKVADSVETKDIRVAAAPKAQVEFGLSCGMQDLTSVPMSIPDVRLADDNKTLVVGKDKVEIQVLDVTVELDGVVIGSSPGIFNAAPGLHKIRLSREGFTPWERTMNVVDGQVLKVALQMSDAGYARWKDNTRFLDNIKNGDKLTDATVKVMEGFAQTLRQSGYRVDTRADVKADIKNDVKANIETKGKSLFDGATLKLFGN